MAIDAFLYFEAPDNGARAILGEAQDKEFSAKKALEITSFTFGIENTTTIGSASGGASSGKSVLNKFSIEKTTDSCTPDFFVGCGNGGHYGKAVLALRKSSGAKRLVFIQYTFSLVFVTKVEWKGSKDDESPTESIEFAYGALTIEYFPQDNKGNPLPKKECSWNQVNNEESGEVVQK